MLGYIILVIAIILLLNKQKIWSLFIFIGFLSGYGGGYGLLILDVIGEYPLKLGFMYMVIAILLDKPNLGNIPSALKKKIRYYIAFLLVSCAISSFYYHITLTDIFSALYGMTFVCGIYVFSKINKEDVISLLRMISTLIFIMSVLYIIQAFTGVKMMPYMLSGGVLETSGLYRFYNSPPFLILFLVLSFIPLTEKIFIFNKNVCRAVFSLACLATLGRTYISISLASIILALLFVADKKRHSKKSIYNRLLLNILQIISQKYGRYL